MFNLVKSRDDDLDCNLSKTCRHRLLQTITHSPGWVYYLPLLPGQVTLRPRNLPSKFLMQHVRKCYCVPFLKCPVFLLYFLKFLLLLIIQGPDKVVFLPGSPEPWVHLGMHSGLAYNCSPIRHYLCLPGRTVHFLHVPWASHSARSIAFSPDIHSLPLGNRGGRQRLREGQGFSTSTGLGNGRVAI